MRRFFYALLAITATAHVPFGLALAFVLGRARVAQSGPIAAAAAVVLGGLVLGRVRRARSDRPISALRLALLEEPYYAHWCASIAALFLFVPALVGWAALGLVASAPPLGAVALACYA